MSNHFFACANCLCQTAGKSIVQCVVCRKIFCSVCGDLFLEGEGQEPQARCAHCLVIRPVLWEGEKEDPRLEKAEKHRRLGIISDPSSRSS